MTLRELWEKAQEVGAEDFEILFEAEGSLRYIDPKWLEFDLEKREIHL